MKIRSTAGTKDSSGNESKGGGKAFLVVELEEIGAGVEKGMVAVGAVSIGVAAGA